jgi:predicted ATPase
MRAAPYWRKAGRLSSQRSAYAEAVSQFNRGLEVLGGEPLDSERLRAALELQSDLADSLAWSKGFAAPEVEAAYSRARELCRRVEAAPELFGILWGLWHFFDISGSLDRARELAEELRDLAESSGGGGRRSQAHRALGETLLWLGEFAASRAETERGIEVCEPGPDSRVLGGESAVVSNRALSSVALWCLGYPDQALAMASAALGYTDEAGSAGDHGMALGFMAWVHLLRREPGPARQWSERLLDFATERGMVFFEMFATIHHGAALAGDGAVAAGILDIGRGMELHALTGADVLRSWFLALQAGAHLHAGRPDEALAAVERGLRDATELAVGWWSAELHRLEAAARLQMNDPAAAERALERAVATARAQQARSLELRAATSLAHLWCDRGRHQEARELLLPVYGWFSEGLDTPDLVAARRVLGEIG